MHHLSSPVTLSLAVLCVQLVRDARYHHSATVEEEGRADVVILASRLASSGLPVTLRTAVGAPLLRRIASLDILVRWAFTPPSAAVVALTAQGSVRPYEANIWQSSTTCPRHQAQPAPLLPHIGFRVRPRWPAWCMFKRQPRESAMRVLQAGGRGYPLSST